MIEGMTREWMSIMIKLTLKLSEFETLHKRADKRKERITVKTDTLRKLLTDHSALLAGLDTSGVTYQEPEDPAYTEPQKPLKRKSRLRIRKRG